MEIKNDDCIDDEQSSSLFEENDKNAILYQVFQRIMKTENKRKKNFYLNKHYKHHGKFIKNISLFISKVWKLCKGIINKHIPVHLTRDKTHLIKKLSKKNFKFKRRKNSCWNFLNWKTKDVKWIKKNSTIFLISFPNKSNNSKTLKNLFHLNTEIYI